MSSNRTVLWIAFSLITGALCAFTAVAEVHRPAAYEQLTAVQLKPGIAPRTVHGMEDLSAREQKHKEQLPMQLDGPVKKVKKAKYRPQKQASKARKLKKHVEISEAKRAELAKFVQSSAPAQASAPVKASVGVQASAGVQAAKKVARTEKSVLAAKRARLKRNQEVYFREELSMPSSLPANVKPGAGARASDD